MKLIGGGYGIKGVTLSGTILLAVATPALAQGLPVPAGATKEQKVEIYTKELNYLQEENGRLQVERAGLERGRKKVYQDALVELDRIRKSSTAQLESAKADIEEHERRCDVVLALRASKAVAPEALRKHNEELARAKRVHNQALTDINEARLKSYTIKPAEESLREKQIAGSIFNNETRIDLLKIAINTVAKEPAMPEVEPPRKTVKIPTETDLPATLTVPPKQMPLPTSDPLPIDPATTIITLPIPPKTLLPPPSPAPDVAAPSAQEKAAEKIGSDALNDLPKAGEPPPVEITPGSGRNTKSISSSNVGGGASSIPPGRPKSIEASSGRVIQGGASQPTSEITVTVMLLAEARKDFEIELKSSEPTIISSRKLHFREGQSKVTESLSVQWSGVPHGQGKYVTLEAFHDMDHESKVFMRVEVRPAR